MCSLHKPLLLTVFMSWRWSWLCFDAWKMPLRENTDKCCFTNVTGKKCLERDGNGLKMLVLSRFFSVFRWGSCSRICCHKFSRRAGLSMDRELCARFCFMWIWCHSESPTSAFSARVRSQTVISFRGSLLSSDMIPFVRLFRVLPAQEPNPLLSLQRLSFLYLCILAHLCLSLKRFCLHQRFKRGCVHVLRWCRRFSRRAEVTKTLRGTLWRKVSVHKC